MLHLAAHAIPPASGLLRAFGPAWIAAMALLDGERVDEIAKRLPDGIVSELRRLVEAVHAAFEGYADAVIAWDAVRRGLTPAAKAARAAWVEHRMAVNKAGAAKKVVDEAQRDYDSALEALRAARRVAEDVKRRLMEAKAAYRAPLAEISPARRSSREARLARQDELRHSRLRLNDTRAAAEKAQRVFMDRLRGYYGRNTTDESAVAFARRLGISQRYVLTVLGKRSKAHLEPEERDQIIAKMRAGVPWWLVAAEYRIHKQSVWRISGPKRQSRDDGGDGNIQQQPPASPTRH